MTVRTNRGTAGAPMRSRSGRGRLTRGRPGPAERPGPGTPLERRYRWAVATIPTGVDRIAMPGRPQAKTQTVTGEPTDLLDRIQREL